MAIKCKNYRNLKDKGQFICRNVCMLHSLLVNQCYFVLNLQVIQPHMSPI